MEPQVYVIINSEAICENKILWDGVTEWTPPPDTLVVPEPEVGMNLEIGQLVAQEIPYIPLEISPLSDEIISDWKFYLFQKLSQHLSATVCVSF